MSKKEQQSDLFKEQQMQAESAFSFEEMERMLKDKQLELDQVRNELQKLQTDHQSLTLRTLKVHEKNKMITASPEIAAQMAEMDFHLSMANRFVKAGAFKCKNAEEAYVKIKAGAEMGLKPVESMQALYIVNGAIKYWGDKMVAKITREGYKVEYLEETEKGVKVRVYHPSEEINFDVTEEVKITDQGVAGGNAVKFSSKNKMRFHGIRMIASFHLPHLFSSVEDEFTQDFHETVPPRLTKNIEDHQNKDERARCLDWIESATKIEQLLQVKEDARQFELTEQWEAAAQKLKGGNDE